MHVQSLCRLVALMAVIGSIALLSGCGKTVSSPPDKSTPESPKAGSEPAKTKFKGPDPDFTMTAMDLSKEFAANEKDAETKYKDKRIRVTGVVLKVEKNKRGLWVLELKGDKMNLAIGIPSGDRTKAQAFKEGATVTVQAECYGVDQGAVGLQKCEFPE